MRDPTVLRLGSAFLLVIGLASVSACDLTLGPPYPTQILTPEVAGIVATTTRSGSGVTTVEVGFRRVSLGANDRAVQAGAPSAGDLLLAGSTPEPWFLSTSFNHDDACYVASASRVFSEPDSVVLAFGRWSGFGIRIPKAPGYDDRRFVVKDAEGHLEYSGFGGIALCLNDLGQITGPPFPSSGRPSG